MFQTSVHIGELFHFVSLQELLIIKRELCELKIRWLWLLPQMMIGKSQAFQVVGGGRTLLYWRSGQWQQRRGNTPSFQETPLLLIPVTGVRKTGGWAIGHIWYSLHTMHRRELSLLSKDPLSQPCFMSFSPDFKTAQMTQKGTCLKQLETEGVGAVLVFRRGPLPNLVSCHSAPQLWGVVALLWVPSH